MADVKRPVPPGGRGLPVGLGWIREIVAVRPQRIRKDLFPDICPLSPDKQGREEQQNNQNQRFLHVAKLFNTKGSDGK
jgi:hypothetical protein